MCHRPFYIPTALKRKLHTHHMFYFLNLIKSKTVPILGNVRQSTLISFFSHLRESPKPGRLSSTRSLPGVLAVLTVAATAVQVGAPVFFFLHLFATT